jgi:hypothetical protein
MSVFQQSKRLVFIALMAVAVALGVISRGMALFGELWLDEQWSCLQVSSISSPLEILTHLLHDNNHPFNSLWIYLVGPFSSPETIRFPSLLYGVTTLFLIARYAPRFFGARVAGVWLLTCLLSYNLILYNSEARGYSMLVLCATWCVILALRAVRDEGNKPSPLLFALVATFGCLAHAAFAMVLAPLMIWCCAVKATKTSRLGLDSWNRWAFIPVCLVGSMLALSFYTSLEIGGAPRLPILQVLLTTLSVTVGGEELSAYNAALSAGISLLALGVLICLVVEVFTWIREDKTTGLLIALLLVTPLIAVTASSPHFILPRYFLFQTVISLLVLSRFAVRLASKSTLGLAISLVLVSGYIAGNARLTWQLLTWGRSTFEAHRRTLIRLYPTEQRTLGTSQEFQTRLRMRYGESWFIAHHGGAADKVTLIPDYTNSSPGPLYVLVESPDRFEPFPESFTTNAGVTYIRSSISPAPISSGAQAAWYKRDDLYRDEGM